MKKILLLSLLLTQPSYAEMMCEDATDYYAIYEPNTYTCNNGQYLPANTLGCVQCPNGWTCNGGTYDFNPDFYQGAILNTITTNTMNNICADNFPIDLYAVYEPNTITINWDDGTNITQSTCEYGGLITLPPTPVRPGYKFGGWRVKKN